MTKRLTDDPVLSLPSRESFEHIYLDLSKQQGKCRLAENGLGWRPSGGGDTFTLDHADMASAQWSRAARGYELKIYTRSAGVVQLDGFVEDVSISFPHLLEFIILDPSLFCCPLCILSFIELSSFHYFYPPRKTHD